MELAASPQSSSSTSYLLRDQPNFYDFLGRMRQPAAADLVRAIKSFIVSFSFQNSDAEDDSKKVQDFLTLMESTIKEHPLWAHAAEKEVDSAIEGLEKYIMTKLFSHTFASSPEDVKLDIEISEKIHLFQHFIKPDHLDVPRFVMNEASLLDAIVRGALSVVQNYVGFCILGTAGFYFVVVLAAKELQKINGFKAPREKLLCVINCCCIINNILLQISMSTNQAPFGADVFLPTLIYVTIKANPPQLHSNLKYIQLFRRHSKLVSEVEYYFTNLISAKTFITNMNASSISMEDSEFQKNMQLANLAREVSLTDASSAVQFFEGNTPALSSGYPFMEAEAKDLTPDDFKVLLGHYKQVVIKYQMLTEALKRLSIDENQLLQVWKDPQNIEMEKNIKQQIEGRTRKGSRRLPE